MVKVFLTLCSALLLVASGQAYPQGSDTAELRAGKARVVERLETTIRTIQEEQKQIGPQRHKPAQKEVPPLPREMRESLDHWAQASIAAQRAMLKTIQRTPAQQVPTLLADTFLSCSWAQCPDSLDPHSIETLITAFGVPALQLLLDRFHGADALKKEAILYALLRFAPPQCSASFLDDALRDPAFGIRAAAIRVYGKNCPEPAFHERLDRLLAQETNPEFLLHLLDEARQGSGLSAWAYDRLIRFAQDSRIPAAQALKRLCTEPAGTAGMPTAAIDVPFWLEVYDTNPQGRRCLVRHLFLKLGQEAQLIQLRRIFRAALDHRYGLSAVQGMSGTASPRQPAYWNAFGEDDQRLLTLFQARLSRPTMLAWMREPATSLGEKMLLARWLGEAPTALLPTTVRLRLEVRSASGALVSATVQTVRRDQPFGFTLAPAAAGFQQIN
jgi:hypothetical protein